MRDTFAQARRRHDRAVMVLLQADMFDPTYTPNFHHRHLGVPAAGADPGRRGLRVRRPGLPGQRRQPRLQHRPPLAAGSSWLTTYRVTGSADNLERITVDGSGNNKDWLKVTVNRPGAEHVLSWERIPYTP